MENHEPIAFFSRAKPQGADVVDLCRKYRRSFIGYPLFKEGIEASHKNLKQSIIDPSLENDEEWINRLKTVKRTNEFSRNKNFIAQVTKGSICLIPRPEQGVVYISIIKSAFQIEQNHELIEEYLTHRKDPKFFKVNDGNLTPEETRSYAANVAQGWETGDYKKVSLALIPGWLRKSMYGRSTYSTFKDHPLDPKQKAIDVLKQLYESPIGRNVKTTSDLLEIKNRLVDSLTAHSFEHLIVSLLQLENQKTEFWHHTGGPGDGGIDGYGCDSDGNMTGLMQAKYYTNKLPELNYLVKNEIHINRYAAVLISSKTLKPSDTTKLLDLNWVAETLWKHRNHIPLAKTLKIGE